MKDLEICKRIAEIEGEQKIEVRLLNGSRNLCVQFCDGKHAFIDFAPYNPLTDDALCFQLMVKYDIGFFPIGELHICAWSDSNVMTFDKNANKAICLAIIEAHKEQ